MTDKLIDPLAESTDDWPRPHTSCEARQHNDQMVCRKCALVWDMNDPDRPDCLMQKPN